MIHLRKNIQDFSSALSAVAFVGTIVSDDVYRIISIAALGIGLTVLLLIVVAGRVIAPLGRRLIQRHYDSKLRGFATNNRFTDGILFERTEPPLFRVIAWMVGDEYREQGYLVSINCPEELWYQGGIGEMCAIKSMAVHQDKDQMQQDIEGSIR